MLVSVSPVSIAESVLAQFKGSDIAPRSRGFLAHDPAFVALPGQTESDGEKLSGVDTQNIADTMRGDQIDIATGNKIDRQLDFTTGGELPLYLERRYNLNWTEQGLFGFVWVSNFDYYLKFLLPQLPMTLPCDPSPGSVPCADTSGFTKVALIRPDGRKIVLQQVSDGVFHQTMGYDVVDGHVVEKFGGYFRMARQADGNWLVTGENGQTELYTPSGFLARLTNEAGLSWNFAYGGINGTQLQSVTHSSGRTITFVWNGIYLKEVRDPAGNTYQYGYAAVGGVIPTVRAGLADVRYPDGMQISYRYGGASRPWGLVKKLYNGADYASFTYDSLGNASGSEHAGGLDKYRFTYTAGDGGTTNVTETNPLGKVSTYAFKGSRLQSVTRTASVSTPAEYKEITYDSNGYRDMVTDFNGNFTDYDYNEKGQLLRIVQGAGSPVARTTTYTWQDPYNRIASVVTDGVLRTDYTYTDSGRLATITQTNLSGKGVPGRSRSTSYSYSLHPNGMVAAATMDGPLPGPGDALTSQFDASGNLSSISNSLGHAVIYSNYDAMGRPGKRVDENGAITEYQYDARGRLTMERQYYDGNAADTRYVYGSDGLLFKTITPDGIETQNMYDVARNLIGFHRNNGDGTYDGQQFTLNAMSQPTRVEVLRTGYPISTAIIGNVDAVNADANWNYSVSGWACSTGMPGSVSVHLYAGGPAGSGSFLGDTVANLASEPEVASRCQTNASAYRFVFPINDDQRRAFPNQGIYVHGISPVGKDNALLSNSGALLVPAIVDSPDVEIIGWTYPSHMVSGEKTTIRLQLRNTGNTTWDPAHTYLAWGPSANSLPNSAVLSGLVAPGQVANFSWNWTAPQLSTSFSRFNFVATLATDGSAWGPQTSIAIDVEDLDGNCDTPHLCEIPSSIPSGSEKSAQGGRP